MAKLIVIAEVLIAQRDREHPLADKGPHLVLDQFLASAIAEAPGKTLHKLDHAVGLTQKQRPRVRSNRPAAKISHNRPFLNRCKIEQHRATLCLHRGTPWA